jgi:hypothetical protein
MVWMVLEVMRFYIVGSITIDINAFLGKSERIHKGLSTKKVY